MDSAIKKINKQQTFLEIISNINYYLISLLLFNFKFYSKTIQINDFSIFHLNKEYKLFSNKFIVLYDNGVFINGCVFIKYEYIISIESFKNTSIIKIFGSIKNNLFDNNLDSTIDILLNLDDPDNFCNILKSNMCYHIKFNKIEPSVIEKFKNMK